MKPLRSPSGRKNDENPGSTSIAEGGGTYVRTDYPSIEITVAGQRSAASTVHASNSPGGIPSPFLPLSRNFSLTWLKESRGFSSKKSGQSSQQVPQLTQFNRSMMTFIPGRLSYPDIFSVQPHYCALHPLLQREM